MEPRLTSLTSEQVKEAELCRKYSDDHGIQSIYEALVFYHKNYQPTRSGPKLSDAAKRFLENRKLQGLAARSLREYEGHFEDLKKSFGEDFATGALTEQAAREYLGRWSAGSLLTFSHRRRTMAALWQWLVDQEELPRNPVARIPNPNNNGILSRGRVPSFYTVAEAQALLKAVRKSELLGFFALALFGGIRTEEIARLQKEGGWKCINFETGRALRCCRSPRHLVERCSPQQ